MQKLLQVIVAGKMRHIPVLKVYEIISPQQTRALAKTPSFVTGSFNHRGVVIPVVKLNEVFGLQNGAVDSPRTTVVIVKVKAPQSNSRIGLLVDSVEQIVESAPAEEMIDPDALFTEKDLVAMVS